MADLFKVKTKSNQWKFFIPQ